MNDAPRQRHNFNQFTREGRKAWLDGVNAYKAGLTMDDCPHPPSDDPNKCYGTKRSAWIAGWAEMRDWKWNK